MCKLLLKPAISTRNTLGKNKRLKSRKLIGYLFEKGQSFSIYPLRVVYITNEAADAPLQAGFTVSGKKFKRAVDRNRIKRLMRESYRLQQHPLLNQLEKAGKRLALFFLYTGKEMPDQALIHEKMGVALETIAKKTG